MAHYAPCKRKLRTQDAYTAPCYLESTFTSTVRKPGRAPLGVTGSGSNYNARTGMSRPKIDNFLHPMHPRDKTTVSAARSASVGQGVASSGSGKSRSRRRPRRGSQAEPGAQARPGPGNLPPALADAAPWGARRALLTLPRSLEIRLAAWGRLSAAGSRGRSRPASAAPARGRHGQRRRAGPGGRGLTLVAGHAGCPRARASTGQGGPDGPALI